MILSIILVVLGVISWIVFMRNRLQQCSSKAAVLKVLTSFIFVCLGLAATAITGDAVFGALMCGGLVCGLVGDFALDLKYVVSADENFYTMTGFTAFSVGHVLYILALIYRYGTDANPAYIIVPIVIAVVIGIAVVALEKVLKLQFKNFKVITLIYSALLFSTTLLSLSFAIMNGFAVPQLTVMFIGGVLFAISDLVLSKIYFAEGQNTAKNTIINLTTYYAAQYLIAFSILL